MLIVMKHMRWKMNKKLRIRTMFDYPKKDVDSKDNDLFGDSKGKGWKWDSTFNRFIKEE